jgi:hypothetical protein
VRVSEEEMHLAYLHREKTGEPIQSWVRRLIRENWARYEPLESSKEGTTGVVRESEPVAETWRSAVESVAETSR